MVSQIWQINEQGKGILVMVNGGISRTSENQKLDEPKKTCSIFDES